MISRDEAERIIVGLTAAHDRIATGMYTIDVHPALGLLRGNTLAGLTAARAGALLPEVDRVWAHFTLFGEVLDQARSLIAPRRPSDEALGEADQLLRQQVLRFDANGMPVDGSSPVASQLSVSELASQLEQRTATLGGHLSEVDAAWTAVSARIGQLTERVDAAATLATDLGEIEVAQRLRFDLAEAHRLDLGDPLSAAPGGRLAGASPTRLATLGLAVDNAQGRLRELSVLRDGYPQRVAALGSLLDELAAAETAVTAEQARVREKIADPGLGSAPAATAVLRAELVDLDRLRHDRQWGQLADDLSTVEASARQAITHAEQVRSNAEGLIDRRDELRGRLTAYQAKAAQQGLAEHEELTALQQAAQALLFTAPCDLRACTRAVFNYQQTLASVLAAVRSDAPGRPAGPQPGGTP